MTTDTMSVAADEACQRLSKWLAFIGMPPPFLGSTERGGYRIEWPDDMSTHSIIIDSAGRFRLEETEK